MTTPFETPLRLPLGRVHLELTNVCAFNCVFCAKGELTRPFKHMDTALAKRILSELSEHRVCKKVTLHVLGEPTRHPDFFEILDHAHREGIRIGLTTDGSTLGGPVGERLLEVPLHQLDISLQTPDARSYELRRSKTLSFDDYASGIRSFFAAYCVRHPRTICKIRFLNTVLVQPEMRERIGRVDSLSTPDDLRNALAAWARWLYEAVDADPKKAGRAIKKLGSIPPNKWNVIKMYDNVYFETYLFQEWTDALASDHLEETRTGDCLYRRDHLAILSNGDLVLCCLDFNGHTAVGNLTDSPLAEVLNSPRLRGVIEGFRQRKIVDPYCRRCQTAILNFGRFLAGKPVRTRLQALLLYLKTHRHYKAWR